MQLYVFPGNIEEEILQIASRQIPYMRTNFFSKIVKESEEMLLEMIGCKNGKTIFYTSSGTGAMDAVVTNYVALKQKAFIVAGGSFGYRWKNLCDYYKITSVLYEVPFAKDIDYYDLECQIELERPKVLLCQHHETSTGQLYNLKELSRICQKYNVSLVVDAISSFLSDPLNMDELHIDICITSSQKGLNIPPGVSIVFISSNIELDKFLKAGYYFDFEENLKNLRRGQTPYSPATVIFLQLHERLKRYIQIGVNELIGTVEKRALYFRSLCNKYGWEIPAENPSNCITGFFVKKGGDILFEELIKSDIYIMPGGIPDFFRVSHLGLQGKYDLDCLAQKIHEIELR